jgi:hypothetical protein
MTEMIDDVAAEAAGQEPVEPGSRRAECGRAVRCRDLLTRYSNHHDLSRRVGAVLGKCGATSTSGVTDTVYVPARAAKA